MSSSEKVLKATIKLVDNFTRPMENAVRRTRELGNTHRELAKRLGKPLNFLFKMDSRVYSYLNKIKEQYTRLKTSFKDYIKVKIEANKAIATINILKRHFSALKNLKTFKAMVSLKDKISGTLSKVTGKIKSFASKAWSATVSVKDKASSVLSSIQGKLSALALGATITLGAKTGFNELANEQTEKLTINRVIQNSGKSKEEAKKSTDEFYKYLEDYANKTPFETSAVTQFGTKAMMMSKGNVDQAKNITDMMGNVKAFVGNLRTETEVAEAFFSASNGNMDMLNTMLGAQYKTFEEAKKGIAKNQGGLVEEMSTTLGGLVSTIGGKVKNSLKGVTKVFTDMLSGSLSGIIGFIDSISPKMVEMADNLLLFYEQIRESGELAQYLQIFKTAGETAFNAIKAVIEACKPVVESIFTFIGEHSTEISAIVKALGTVWGSVWKQIGTLLQGAWLICEPILSLLVKGLAKVSGAVETICTWWNKMTNLLKTPINAVVNVTKGATSWLGNKLGLSEGNNAFGSGRIARDGTIRTLHEGEKVLTKRETDAYLRGQNGPGVNITVNSLSVREEADVNKIANALVKKLKEASLGYSSIGGMA